MDENTLKERISECFIKLLAHRIWYIADKPSDDRWVDMTISKTWIRIDWNKRRFCTTGHSIDVQLKATTENGIIDSDEHISYDLEVKNYNDMIMRKAESAPNPLILVLFILPNDPTTRINFLENNDGIQLKKCGYRYYPEDSVYSNTSSTKRISIDKNNKLCTETVENWFNTFTR